MKVLKIEDLKKAMQSASNNLFNNKERIDALNVFPVPDGDTGSNMATTFQKSMEIVLNEKHTSIKTFVESLSKNMLMNARGNSGVILSQIFKGLASTWAKYDELKVENIIEGFLNAKKNAYSSVLKPVEGTILTVIRETYEELAKMKITTKTNIGDVFKKAEEAAKNSVKNTPNLLPLLKEVGVVDSGGEGLLMVIKGFNSFISKGKKIEIDFDSTRPLSVVENTEVYSGEFGYCTELIIDIKSVKGFSKRKFVAQIEKMGNSVVVVNDKNILKLHIHTKKPGKILDVCQKVGEFLKIKIENMTEQANSTKSNVEGIKNFEVAKQAPKKQNAIISCNSGSGFLSIMNELGCDFIIDGGNTNNPSAKDIIEAIKYVNAENIIILPNNKNTILAAQQASKIESKHNIQIIPTKTQVEGITAIMNYSSELEMKDNTKEINLALKKLVVGEIAKSVKDTKINNVKIKSGSYLMITKEGIIGTKKTALLASKALIDKMMKIRKNFELLTIYCGNDSSDLDTKEIEKYVLEKYDVEVLVQQGDQYLYEFAFGLE